jgi:adenosine/AMP kinase
MMFLLLLLFLFHLCTASSPVAVWLLTAPPGRKVRFDGNDDALIELAKKNAMALGAGHTFVIFLDGGFPVNCLNAVKAVPEVCRVRDVFWVCRSLPWFASRVFMRVLHGGFPGDCLNAVKAVPEVCRVSSVTAVETTRHDASAHDLSLSAATLESQFVRVGLKPACFLQGDHLTLHSPPPAPTTPLLCPY